MQAVNLVPAGERRGAGGAAGRSSGAVYVVLALLAVLVVVVTLATTTRRSTADKRAEIATVSAQAVAAEAQASSLADFEQFASLRAARTQTVVSLAASRFDWAHALGELARVIPADVSLTSLKATVTPTVTLKAGGGGDTSALRSSLAVPAIELTGCTVDQDAVARLLTSMRQIDGVTRVSLQSSAKPAVASGGSTDAAPTESADATCRRGKAGAAPTFGLVVFFDQTAAGVPTSAASPGRIPAAQLTPSGSTGASGPASAAGATP